MVNAQEWLDKEYPKNGKCLGKFDSKNKGKRRDEITELDIGRKELKGKINLENFINLEIFECCKNKLTELNIGMCSKLKMTDCGYNWLENLDFGNNKKINFLICWHNRLKKIDITNCHNLKYFGCSSNLISDLNLDNNFQLQMLDIAHNNFSRRDLSFLSHLTKLDTILLNNEKKEGSIRNRFCGSLEPLKELKLLKLYNISNTEIDDSIDSKKYLPSDAEVLNTDFRTRSSSQIENTFSSLATNATSLLIKEPRAIPTIIKNPFQLVGFARGVMILYDSVKKEVKQKIKARNLLQEEFREKDDKIQQLEEEYNLLQGKSTNLQDQIEQLREEIENKIKEIIDLRKQKIKAEEKLDKIHKINSFHENLISNLEQDLTEKNNKLKQAEEDLKLLKDRAEKLLKQCQYYLELISNYYQKQRELERLKKNSVGKPLSNEELDKLLASQKFIGKLEEKIENIIKEQNLFKKDFLKNIRREDYDPVTNELGAENNKFISIEDFENLLINNKKKLEVSINNINVQVGNIDIKNSQIGGSILAGVGQISDGVDLSVSQNWTNLHPNFTPSLINQWKTNNFTYEKTQEWINIGLTINDSDFCAWLRDTKHLTAEECLNYHDLNQLKNEYQTQLSQTQIQIPPKN